MSKKKMNAHYHHDYGKIVCSQFDGVELMFSALAPFLGYKKWYCRVWVKGWYKAIHHGEIFHEGRGDNKFEAYRNAVKNLT